MSEHLSLKEIQKEWHGSLKAYVTGFIASLILTVISFSLVITKWMTGQVLIYTIVALALVQAAVQLIFFLHLGKEDKPRWESVAFYFMVVVLVIVVIGSLWIMFDLNSRVMDM